MHRHRTGDHAADHPGEDPAPPEPTPRVRRLFTTGEIRRNHRDSYGEPR